MLYQGRTITGNKKTIKTTTANKKVTYCVVIKYSKYFFKKHYRLFQLSGFKLITNINKNPIKLFVIY